MGTTYRMIPEYSVSSVDPKSHQDYLNKMASIGWVLVCVKNSDLYMTRKTSEKDHPGNPAMKFKDGKRVA